MMPGTTAFITGGTGFLGSHLVKRLVRDGYRVHLLCREKSDFWRLRDLLPQVERHVAVLEDGDRLREIVAAVQPEVIFHLASATVVAGRTGASEQLVITNVLGAVHLLEACESVGYRALVMAGDSFEYAASHGPLDESGCCHPTNLHGVTKLAATLFAQSMALAQHRPITILRLFSTYGPFDNPKRLIPRVIAHALAGTSPALSRREIARDWVYVDDVVELFLEAAEKAYQAPGGIFNAGSGISTDLETVVKTICRLTGSQAQPEWGKFVAPDHDGYPWVADTRQTFEQFTWRPVTTLEGGLLATIRSIQAT